jgi:antitoxin HicB
MVMRGYAASLLGDKKSGGYTVTFRDVPEAVTEGQTLEEALRNAVDALESALSLYIADREALPVPTLPKRGERMVPLSALGMAKVALHEAMRERVVGRAELARRLGWHFAQINRVLDLCHASKMEQVEIALAALGKRLIVDAQDAA